MFGRSASSGEVIDTGRPSMRSSPSAISRMPKEARKRSSWPMPWSPATPRISPLMESEGRVPELLAGGEVLDREDLGRVVGLTAGRGGKVWAIERPMIISMICASLKSATAPVAICRPLREHGQVIAEGPHLAHAMRDEDDGHAGGLEAGDDLAEPVDVAAGERRGRLVEQEDARLAVDGAGDLDLLLDGEVEFADLVAEIDVEAERVEMGANRALRRRAAGSCRSGRPARRAGACCRGPSGPGPASFPGTRSGCRGRGRRAASGGGPARRRSRSGPGRARSARRAA